MGVFNGVPVITETIGSGFKYLGFRDVGSSGGLQG